MFKKLRPIFIKSPRFLKLISKFAPIDINAIALFPLVIVRGNLTSTTRTHETIHFQQQLELGVIPFYIIYLLDYYKIRKKGYFGWIAYRQIRAECEAHVHQYDQDYLQKRKRWQWLKKNKPIYK